jgi:LysM domain
MRWRTVIIVSLVANLLLAAGWFWSARQSAIRTSRRALGAEPPAMQIKTNVVIRRQFFSWQEVESDDYRTYIANLRDIGCPEQTIRDIIIADVNALYAKKRAREVVSPEQQWWRTEPDTNTVQVATVKIQELEEERRALLTSLLGLGWESGDLVSLPRPSHSGVALDGPVLGVLPDDVKKTVQQIIANFQEQVDDWREAHGGQAGQADLSELTRLNQRLRKELAQVLSPQQLEEFMLRYSTTASTLRTELGQLKFFNATPDEFRAMFRAADAVNQQIQLLSGATDATSVEQRAALEQQREGAIRLALGPERYAQYRMLHQDAYRDAVTAAREADSPASAPAFYEINQATADELARIRANTNFTDTQRAIELKKAELEQLKATAVALGQDLPPEAAPPPTPPQGMTHVLKAGETIGTVALSYGISPILLREANPGLDLFKLKPGDSVKIPLVMPPTPVVPMQPPK